MRSGQEILYERAAQRKLTVPAEHIPGDFFQLCNLPFVVACTACTHTMSFMACLVDTEMRVFCEDCGSALDGRTCYVPLECEAKLSPNCWKKRTLRVTPEDWGQWEGPADRRPVIQELFPYLSPAERELIQSGTCGACYKALPTDAITQAQAIEALEGMLLADGLLGATVTQALNLAITALKHHPDDPEGCPMCVEEKAEDDGPTIDLDVQASCISLSLLNRPCAACQNVLDVEGPTVDPTVRCYSCDLNFNDRIAEGRKVLDVSCSTAQTTNNERKD